MCACVLVCFALVLHCYSSLSMNWLIIAGCLCLGNEWYCAQSQLCQPWLFARVEVKLQFSASATRCRLHHKEHMASSLMGILFSALVAVLWRIRPNEIGGKKSN